MVADDADMKKAQDGIECAAGAGKRRSAPVTVSVTGKRRLRSAAITDNAGPCAVKRRRRAVRKLPPPDPMMTDMEPPVATSSPIPPEQAPPQSVAIDAETKAPQCAPPQQEAVSEPTEPESAPETGCAPQLTPQVVAAPDSAPETVAAPASEADSVTQPAPEAVAVAAPEDGSARQLTPQAVATVRVALEAGNGPQPRAEAAPGSALEAQTKDELVTGADENKRDDCHSGKALPPAVGCGSSGSGDEALDKSVHNWLPKAVFDLDDCQLLAKRLQASAKHPLAPPSAPESPHSADSGDSIDSADSTNLVITDSTEPSATTSRPASATKHPHDDHLVASTGVLDCDQAGDPVGDQAGIHDSDGALDLSGRSGSDSSLLLTPSQTPPPSGGGADLSTSGGSTPRPSSGPHPYFLTPGAIYGLALAAVSGQCIRTNASAPSAHSTPVPAAAAAQSAQSALAISPRKTFRWEQPSGGSASAKPGRVLHPRRQLSLLELCNAAAVAMRRAAVTAGAKDASSGAASANSPALRMLPPAP